MLERMQIGHYRLQRFIGSGAMGEVYLAEDTRIARQVAVKVLKKEISLYPQAQASDDALRLFQREMKAVAALDHSNILPLFDFGEQALDKVIYSYMVMPFRPEGSLVDWLHQRNTTAYLSPQDVVQIIHQAADALQHAHNRHLMHLDIKPSNFLLRQHENSRHLPDVLLADFGIAKFTTATSTTSQTIRGTPPYMAPEQWSGTPAVATDQYALAIMAYQLLTGRFPFEGNAQQVMYKHLQERPQPPGAFNSLIPPGVNRVILKALEKKPEERFSSILAFATAFEQAWQSEKTYVSPQVPPTLPATYVPPQLPPTLPVEVRPAPPTQGFPIYAPSPTVAPQHNLPRRTVLAGLAAAGVLAIGGGITWWVSTPHPSASTTNPPTSTVSSALASPATIPLSTAFTLGSTWQGTYYQHDQYGNFQTSFVLHVTALQDTTFSGTVTEATFDGAVIAVTGSIVSDSNSLASPDKERFQVLINRYGHAGTLIMFTDTSQIQGNNILLNCHYYALATQAGSMSGIEYDAGHTSEDLTTDGEFMLSKTG